MVVAIDASKGLPLLDISTLSPAPPATLGHVHAKFSQAMTTVIHQPMLHQKLKVHLKHDRETFSLKNCTVSPGDLHSLFPPNFRALGFVAVD
jgi:hypothetical protein